MPSYAPQQQRPQQGGRGGGWLQSMLQRLRQLGMHQLGPQQRGALLQGAGQAMQGGGLGGLQSGLQGFRNWRQQQQPRPGPGQQPAPPPQEAPPMQPAVPQGPSTGGPDPVPWSGGGEVISPQPGWGGGNPWMPNPTQEFKPFNPGFPKPVSPAKPPGDLGGDAFFSGGFGRGFGG